MSRRASTREGILKLGANEYIATDKDLNWVQKHGLSLDLIICTVSSPKMLLSDYLSLLDTNGKFIQVGAPEDALPQILAFDLISKGRMIGGSGVGPPWQIREMLQFAADKKIKPWVEQRPMSDANEAILDLAKGLPRFRYTLVNSM